MCARAHAYDTHLLLISYMHRVHTRTCSLLRIAYTRTMNRQNDRQKHENKMQKPFSYRFSREKCAVGGFVAYIFCPQFVRNIERNATNCENQKMSFYFQRFLYVLVYSVYYYGSHLTVCTARTTLECILHSNVRHLSNGFAVIILCYPFDGSCARRVCTWKLTSASTSSTLCLVMTLFMPMNGWTILNRASLLQPYLPFHPTQWQFSIE